MNRLHPYIPLANGLPIQAGQAEVWRQQRQLDDPAVVGLLYDVIVHSFVGSPTAGGTVQAYFDLLAHTSGGNMADESTQQVNAAGGEKLLRLGDVTAPERTLLPMGPFPTALATAPAGAFTEVRFARVVANVPHAFTIDASALRGAGGATDYTPAVVVSAIATPLTVLPQRVETPPTVYASGILTSGVAVSTVFKRINKVILAEKSGTADSVTNIQLRDGSSGGQLVGEWTLAAHQSMTAFDSAAERDDIVLTSGSAPFLLVQAATGATLGSARVIIHGRT